MDKPRKQEDFDNWFLKEKGDPWGYDNPYVQERLRTSLSFVKKKINSDFNGTFIEFGAFDGSFTKLLGRAYPKAEIIANDISQIAVSKLQTAVAHLENVKVVLSDMIAFTDYPVNLDESKGIVVLLMECLYYLPFEEQVDFLKKLRIKYRNLQLFLSAPMTGGNYYDEPKLQLLLNQSGFRIVSRGVMTYTNVPPFPTLFNFLLNRSRFFRKQYASQVIHYIRPKHNA